MRTGSMPFRPRGAKQRSSRGVGDPTDARGLYAAMRRYLEHRGVMGSTEAGLYSSERYIRDFIAWGEARAITHPQQVTQAVLARYQRWLYYYRKKDGGPLSIASQRNKITPLKSFFKWLTRAGELPANPAAEIDLPRKIKRLPRHILSVEEVERVLQLADTGQVVGLRDRAMMEVLYSTGIRRMEISRLQIGDIDLDKNVVLIRQGKWGKDRLIPLGERAQYWVRQYLDESRPLLAWNPQDTTLFLGQEGMGLSMTWLSTIVAQYVKRAELGKHGGCHLFRHTMATLMLEDGADIRFIQAMLGHAELSTTQIYTQVAIRQLQLVHASTHPGALRHARSAPAQASEDEAQGDAQNPAATLLAALTAEAEEEDGDDDADGNDSADAP